MNNPRKYWFYGRDDGSWEFTGEPILSFRTLGFDWQLAPAMSSANQRRNFDVEGATETHDGFRRALRDIVNQYPELNEWVISFDGPAVPIIDVISLPAFSWEHWTFFHGTAEAYFTFDHIKRIMPTNSHRIGACVWWARKSRSSWNCLFDHSG